jgi:hypothetical protein
LGNTSWEMVGGECVQSDFAEVYPYVRRLAWLTGLAVSRSKGGSLRTIREENALLRHLRLGCGDEVQPNSSAGDAWALRTMQPGGLSGVRPSATPLPLISVPMIRAVAGSGPYAPQVNLMAAGSTPGQGWLLLKFTHPRLVALTLYARPSPCRRTGRLLLYRKGKVSIERMAYARGSKNTTR